MIIKIIYCCYILGIFMWQYQVVYETVGGIKNRIIIRRNLSQLTNISELKKYSKFTNRIKLAIEGASMEKVFKNPETFYGVSVISALATFFIVSMIESITMSVICGGFVGLIPYAAVMARLYEQRVNRSREGDIMVNELLNNYKIYSFNIKEAIEVTANTISNAPNARKLLMNLAKGLNNAVTKDEVNKVLMVFKYSIDTAWGNVLGANIFFAHTYGIKVDSALEDLALSITKSRQVVEHGKRENNEAYLMLKYLAPISFILTIVGAIKYFGFTLDKYIKYQFATAMGLKWFMIMAMVYGCGLLVNGYFSREKMDI